MGDSFVQTFQLAQEDIQTYLADLGSDLQVELLIEDNQSNPSYTWQAVEKLREQGVSIFLGPQDSQSLNYMRTFADEEDYLLLSSASTAVANSIANDNTMRCISDDSLQAAALIDRLEKDGIENIIILARSNIYGQGLEQALEKGWRMKNDLIDSASSEIISDVSFHVSTIPLTRPQSDIPEALQQIKNLLEEKTFADTSKTAVIMVVFDEGVEILEQAAQIEGLDAVRWYGTDGIAQNHLLPNNGTAAQFAATTQFTCTEFMVTPNEAYTNLQEELTSRLGYTPPMLAVIGYDTYQLAVRAYLEAGSEAPNMMKPALRLVAENYEGVTGNLAFNQNDDRAEGYYDYWTMTLQDGGYTWESESGEVWHGEHVLVSDWMLMK